MKITITKDNGEVFAIHEVGQEMAEHLRFRLQDVTPGMGVRLTEPDHEPGGVDAQDFLSDLDTAIKGTVAGTFDREDV